MSYTIVHDGEQASRDLENVVNRVLRHCKIGNVKRKSVAFPSWPAKPSDWWMAPYPFYDPFRDIRAGGNRRKCSCLPFQACGNAACPHAPVVT